MYELRRYDIEDKEKVIKLWLKVCIEEYGFNHWEEELKSLIDDEYDEMIVVVHENEIIGTIAYKHINNEIAELKRVYIDQEHRGKGLAKTMLNSIIEKISENGYKKIHIETWKNFVSGRKFYEKNDFVLQDVQGEVYHYIREL